MAGEKVTWLKCMHIKLELETEVPEFKTVLIGRDKELDHMRKHVDSLEKGKGSCIMVSGEAGVGKTSLAEETGRYAELLHGYELLYGRCQDTKTPFLPWMEALKKIDMDDLIYTEPVKIEYASLIERTGISLASVQTLETDLDDDILNSMVDVVRNFINDSLGKLGMGSEKKENILLQHGEYSILLETGEYATGMAISKGKIGPAVIRDVKETISEINRKEAKVLKNWDGDLERIAHMDVYLEQLLKKHDGIKDTSKVKDERYLLFESVSEEIFARANRQPIILIIDDLQWSDASTRELFHYISRNTKKEPLFMIGIYRIEEVKEGLQDTLEKMSREGLKDSLELGRLLKKDVKKLITLRYGVTNDKFINAVFKKTEGNPFFIEEILRTLEAEEKIDKDDPKSFEKLDLSAIETISQTVSDVISRRIRGLDKQLYKVLEWMSVIGTNVEYEVLYGVLKDKFGPKVLTQKEIQEIIDKYPKSAAKRIAEAVSHNAEFDHSHMSQLIRNLMDINLIREEGTYKFDNVLIQETVYEKIPKGARPSMHSFVGEKLEEIFIENLDEVVEKLASQYVLASNSKKAYEYCLMAGDKAALMFAPTEALRHYENILAFGRKVDKKDRLVVLDRIIRMSEDTAWGRAIDLGEEVIALRKDVDDPLMLSRAYRITAMLRTEKNSETEIGLEYIENALELGKDSDEETLKNMKVKAEILQRDGKYDQAFMNYKKAMSKAYELVDEDLIAQIKVGMGALFYLKGDLDSSVDYFKDSINVLERKKQFDVLSKAYNNVGIAYISLEMYDEAIKAFERGVEIGQKVNHEYAVVYSFSNLADAYAKKFIKTSNKAQLNETLSYAEKASESANRIGNKRLIAVTEGLFGYAHGLAGNMDESKKHFDNSLKSLKKANEWVNYADVLHDRSVVYKINKMEDKQIADIEEALEIYKRFGQDKMVRELENELYETKMADDQQGSTGDIPSPEDQKEFDLSNEESIKSIFSSEYDKPIIDRVEKELEKIIQGLAFYRIKDDLFDDDDLITSDLWILTQDGKKYRGNEIENLLSDTGYVPKTKKEALETATQMLSLINESQYVMDIKNKTFNGTIPPDIVDASIEPVIKKKEGKFKVELCQFIPIDEADMTSGKLDLYRVFFKKNAISVKKLKTLIEK